MCSPHPWWLCTASLPLNTLRRALTPLSHPGLLLPQCSVLKFWGQRIIFSPGDSKMQIFCRWQSLGSSPLANLFSVRVEEVEWAVPGKELMSSQVEKWRLTGNPHWLTILPCCLTIWIHLGTSGYLLLENQAIPWAMERTKHIFQCVSCVGSVMLHISPLLSRRVSRDFSTSLLGLGNVIITEVSPPLQTGL